jgi:hypothetical protein
MEIENIIQYAPFAVGLKPSAIQGEARLRGLWRIICSKTISPPETYIPTRADPSYPRRSVFYSRSQKNVAMSW